MSINETFKSDPEHKNGDLDYLTGRFYNAYKVYREGGMSKSEYDELWPRIWQDAKEAGLSNDVISSADSQACAIYDNERLRTK